MEERQDLISRQVAIDALRDAENHAFNSFYKGLAKAHKIIADLPSVQPDHVADTGRKVEQTGETAQSVQDEDLISRKAAIEALARMMPRSYTPDGSHPADEEIFRAQEVFADCIEALEILPSAQPEIIRCKDCKHYLHDEEYGFDWCNRMSGVFRAKPDGFCSWAVMRGGGTE